MITAAMLKSQITTVIHNNAQLIKDVISVICVINNKPQYCTYLWSSATNLQHYRPYHPYGVPPYFVILRETQSLEKISWQRVITRIVDFTWRVSDCEELVGVTHRR